MEDDHVKWTEGSKAERKQAFDKGKNNDESEGENDSKEQETMMDEMKLEQEDLKAKFERFEQLSITKIPKYSKKEKRLQPPELLNQEEIDKIYNDFNIDFDPNAVSKTIKRGREELDAKKGEYAKKKQDLETFEISLREDKNDIQQKTESHQEKVSCALKLESELNQDLSEIINQQVICETDKENFASNYVQLKSEKRKYEERKSKLNLQIAKEEAIVETYNDVLLFRSQKTESKFNQNEESSEHLDSIANSIAINSTEVKNCCKDVKTAISSLVDNKNDEIQQAKNLSEEENQRIYQNTTKFNSTMDLTKTSLQSIEQNVKNIKNTVQDCKNNQLSERINTTYDFNKNILKPLKDSTLQLSEFDHPQFCNTDIDKTKQQREIGLKELTDVQNQLRELMILGSKSNLLKGFIDDNQKQITSLENTIQDSENKIKIWNSLVLENQQKRNKLEDEIDAKIITTCNNNFVNFYASEEDRLVERETQINQLNNEQFALKEDLCKQLLEENSKLENLRSELKIEMQKDCSKILNVLIKYIHYMSTDPDAEKSALAKKIILNLPEDLYYNLKHFVFNKMSSDKVNYYWESFIPIEKAEKCITDLEPILAQIEKLKKSNAKKYQSLTEQGFDSKFYNPLKELSKYKDIQLKIQQQEQVVKEKNIELEKCKLMKIGTLKMTSIKDIHKNEIGILLENKKIIKKEFNELNQNIQDIQSDICYAQGEMKSQQNICNNIKQENKQINIYQNKINSEMNKCIKIITEYISLNIKSKTIKNELENELLKIKEGCFDENKTDTNFSQICNEYINSVDKVFAKSIGAYTSECINHETAVWKQHTSQFDGYKQYICELINQGLKEMNQVNQDNINKFDKILFQINNTINIVDDASSHVQEQRDSILEYINKESEILKNINQSFEFVHNKLIGIDSIVDEAPWEKLSKSIKELINRPEKNNRIVSSLFKRLEEQIEAHQAEIEKNLGLLETNKKKIDKRTKILNKLKGLEPADDDRQSSKSIANREQIKSKITEVNRSIKEFNKKTEKYQQKLDECIQSKMELNNLEFQLQAKRDKIQEIENIHEDVRDKLTKKYKEIRAIEDKIKMMNVNTIEYKNCNIIVRKNDLTEELSEAIVNPTNEQLMHEGDIARAIADKGGNIICEESKKYISKNGKLSSGQATMTNAGKLPCKYVIHAVGPRYNKNLPDNSIAHSQMKMVTNSIMNIVKKENFESVSIPAISTGIFGFPVGKVASIIGNTVRNFIDLNNSDMRGKTIVFCNFDDSTTDVFNKVIPGCFSDKVKEDRDEEEDNNEESKQVESDSKECTDSIQICKSCKRGITEKKHQARGKHLNLCYRCYKKKKEKKRKEIERKEENEESEEDTKANKKMLKNNKKDHGNSSEDIEQNKVNKRKSQKNQKKYDKSDEDSESDKKKKKNKKTSTNKSKSRKRKSIHKSKKESQSNDSEDESKAKQLKKEKSVKRTKEIKNEEDS